MEKYEPRRPSDFPADWLRLLRRVRLLEGRVAATAGHLDWEDLTWLASVTAPTMGDSTLICRYTRTSMQAHCAILLTLGTGFNAGSGDWGFGPLPFTVSLAGPHWGGHGVATDVSANTNYDVTAKLLPGATSTSAIIHVNADVNATTPFAWGIGDTLSLVLACEVEE